MPIRDGKVVQWKHALRIKNLITHSGTDAEAKQSARRVLLAVRSKLFMQDWRRMDALMSAKTIGEVNSVLDSLYDYCDANLIWVE